MQLCALPHLRYHGHMISYLRGTVLAHTQTFLILEVGGVGYRVHCTGRILDTVRTGTELAVYTHLAVREDAMELFGFNTYEELAFFQLLIGISGIGPRSALGIIGLEHIEKLTSAIAHGDIGYLTKVSGVGKKSAEKIVLELKDKIPTLDIGTDSGGLRREEEDALEALKALGYRAEEARTALHQIPETITEPSARIKEALQLLARG